MNKLDFPLTALFGQHAVHVPLNYIAQQVDDGKILIVGQSQVASGDHPLHFGGNTRLHQLVMGDVVFRPHLVIESEHLCGHGVSGIVTGGWDLERWVSDGRVVMDPAGHIKRS